METNAIAENNVNWLQNAEASEILVSTTNQKEKLANQVLQLLKIGIQTVWRVFWALWALPTIRIQKAPGECILHTEEYENLQNQIVIQNYLRPY